MAKWTEKYEALSEANKAIVDEMVDAAVGAVGSEAGTIVLLTDPLGDGRANFLYGGNELLVEPLLHAGVSISQQLFDCGQGPMQ